MSNPSSSQRTTVCAQESSSDILISKLNDFKIADESCLKELKSIIKDATFYAETETTETNGLQSDHSIWGPFVESIQSQLRENVKGDTTSILMFIKTLAEMHISGPSTTNVADKAQTPKNGEVYVSEDLWIPLLPTFLEYVISILEEQFVPSDLHRSATALHQMLGVIHKTVRTSFSVLRRFESIQNRLLADTNQNPVFEKVMQLAELLCTLLLNPMLESELDIKCSIGLAICLSVKILRGQLAYAFFNKLFSNNDSWITTDLSPIEDKVLRVSEFTVNRIALAFGVLNISNPDDKEVSLELLKSVAGNILSIEHGTKEATNLGSARIVESWMLKLLTMDPGIYTEIKYLLLEIEFFLFNNLAGHIDAVKGCCRCIIEMVAKVYDTIDGPGKATLVKEFLERFLHKPSHVKWAGISWTSKGTPKSLCLLEIVKDVPEMLLSSERVFKNAANDTYLGLAGYHYEVVALEKWLNLWIEPLFRSHKVQTCESNWTQKRTIICSLLKSNKNGVPSAVMQYVLTKLNFDNMASPEASQLAVEAVKIATELGIKMKDLANLSTSPDSFHGIIPRKVLNSWLWSGNPQARIAAFSLIVDTKKTSDPISFSDFESIKLFLCYNLVSQSPAFRQQYLALFKKLLKRLKDSFALLKKKQNVGALSDYHNFFKWLWNSFTQQVGLFPGANFARRCQALEVLAEFTSQFEFDLFFSDSSEESLNYLRWLNDSYENNKIMGFKILEKMPMPQFQDPDFAEKLMADAFSICASVKPPESVTGRYLVVFIMKKCASVHPPLTVLTRLYHKLNEIVQTIEATSLMEVSGQIAIYGYISCIRMILAESKEYLIKKAEYRALAEQLIAICFKLNHIFFPLLGCAAPEGTLIDKPDENQKSLVVRSIGAQKMLVCSWRSMRDACHLMNEMCSLFPLEGEEDEYIISFEQAESIGNHQLYLLKNLMHRGVFEQIFVGFKLLATRLYKSPAPNLTKLIDNWLDAALDEDLMSSKSTTRRSGGLPFILQALLAPGAGNEAFICKYITGLFNKESGHPQIRIHIMNVLRALFRDANFARSMMPYVPFGLRMAFKAQANNYWPEQNSGLMLLGAVVRRTFGPLLNSMSASTFFRKFPEMYEFLLGEVQSCSMKIHEKNSTALDFTFYVLVLLSSFATKGVVEDAHFPLHRFISSIRECGASEDVRVRKIAAKALIPFLLDPANQIETIHEILSDLKDLSLNTYQIHGNLCQLLSIFQAIPKERITPEVIANIGSLKQSQALSQSKNPLAFETLAEICAEIDQDSNDLWKCVYETFQTNFPLAQNRHSVPDLPGTDRKICEVKIFFELTSGQNTDPCRTVYNWIIEKNLVFIEQLLSFLCSDKISIFDNESASIVLDALVRKYVTTDFFYEGQRKVEELFLQLFCKVPKLVYNDWLIYVLESDDKIVSNFFEKVLHICEMESGTMICKAKAIEVLGKLACKVETNLAKDHKDRFCHVLTLLCDSTSHDEIRFGVAKCLPDLMKDNNFKMFTVNQQCKLWYTFLILAQDDEYFVREEINSKYGSEFGTFCDIKLIENLIQLFFNNFAVNHLQEGLTLLTGIILRDDYIVAEEADDSEEERLFDKSEINSFNEPLHVAKIVREFLDQNVKVREDCKNIFRNVQLDKELVDLYEFVSNSLVISKTDSKFTLHDLCISHLSPKEKPSTSLSLSNFIQSDKSTIQNTVRQYLLDIFN